MYSAPEKQWRTRRVLVLCVEPCRSVPPCPASITYRTAVADGTGREVAELDGETTNASLLALRVFVYSAPEKQWRTQRTLILADSWRRTVPFCPALPAVPAALNAIVRRCAVLWVETSERVRCARVRNGSERFNTLSIAHARACVGTAYVHCEQYGIIYDHATQVRTMVTR